MSFGDGVKRLIGIEEYDEEISDKEIEAAKKDIEKESKSRFRQEKTAPAAPAAPAPEKKAAPAPAPVKPDRRHSMTNTSSFKLLLIEPKSFEECQKLVDSLKTRRPIIMTFVTRSSPF